MNGYSRGKTWGENALYVLLYNMLSLMKFVLSGSSITYVLLLAGINDLQDVMSAVADLARKWWMFGITLGLRAADLDFIQSTKSHSISRCLRDMLSLWLRQQYDVHTKLVHMLCLHTKSVE